MKARIVPIFRQREPLTPATQTCIGEATHISLETLIDATQFSAGNLEQQTPKFACEDAITVRNDGQGNTVEPEDGIHEKTGNLSSRKGVLQRNEMSKLRELIDNHQNGVGKPQQWQALDEVQRDDFPRSVRYWKGLQQPRISRAIGLGVIGFQEEYG